MDGNEDLGRWYNVDGLSFSVHVNRVEGFGWQGRYFRYLPNQENLTTKVLDKLNSLKANRGIYKLQVPNRRRTPITFTARESNGWINIRDRSRRRRMEFARSDIKALMHIFSVLEEFRKSPETHLDHFCPEYGVEDDD